MLPEEEKVVYTPYKELADPKLTEDKLKDTYLTVITLLESLKWKDNYEALESLRILNKFYFGYLSTKLEEIDPYIQTHLDSLRSGLLKMALLFTQEVAGSEAGAGESAIRSAALKSYLPKQIPILLMKLLDAKKFIVKEAEIAMESVCTMSCSPEVIIALCEQCFTGLSKGTTFADNVIGYLELGLQSHASKELWDDCNSQLVVTLGQAVNTGRKQMLKKVSSILATLKKVCGEEAVLANIKGANLAKIEEQKLEELLAGKEGKKKPDLSFKAFLQAKKNAKA